MAFVTLFVPEDFLNIPTHGSIQYHPSLLPAYRGASAINWPIIKGEKETGLSIFWPDNGLDTGDVLMQKKTPISATDTLGTVYFDRLFPMGVEAMLEVGRSREGRQGAAHQAGRSRRRPTKAAAAPTMPSIDWGKPWEQIDRLIRGCNPAPGAWSHARRQDREDLRRQAAAGEGPEGHRRQDRRDRRGRRRRLHGGLRRRPLQGHARAAADGPKVGAGEWANGRQARRRRALHLIPSPLCPRQTRRNPPSDPLSRLIDGSSPCPPRSISHRNPTSKSRRPPRRGRIVDVAKEKLGIAAENLEPYGHYKAKVSMDYIKSLQGQEERQADPGHGDLADAGGRRQDHHHGRPHRRAQPHRQEGDAVPARAVARPVASA